MFFGMLSKLAMVGKNKSTPTKVEYAPALLNSNDRQIRTIKPGDKVIWGYWHSGRSSMPGYCEFCVRTWEARNPGWKVIILDEASLSTYVQPEDLPSTFGSLKVQHQSDIVRLAVLIRFGGVYLDVSTFCLQGFDEIFSAGVQKGGPSLLLTGPTDGTFHSDPYTRFPNNALIVARKPGDPILQEWRRRILAYSEHPCANVAEMETHPAFHRVCHLFRDRGLGVLQPSVGYLAYLFLLMDILGYDEEWSRKVASGVGLLPTDAWTFDFFVLLDPPRDGTYTWNFTGFVRRLVRFLNVRWGDNAALADAIRERVAVVKSSSDGNVEMHKPAEWFVQSQRRTTLARLWRAASDPESGQPQASLKGLRMWPRGKQMGGRLTYHY